MEREWWSSFFLLVHQRCALKMARVSPKRYIQVLVSGKSSGFVPSRQVRSPRGRTCQLQVLACFHNLTGHPYATREPEYRKYVRPLGSQSSDLHTTVASLKGEGDWVRFLFFLPDLNPSLSLCWSTSKPWLSSFKGHNARARFLSSFALLKKKTFLHNSGELFGEP